MAKDDNDFTKGSIPRNILSMALPMTLAQVINLLYNIVDRIYIGRIPVEGTLALTGLGLTFPIITILSAFANLFGMGGAPLCSIARGRKDNKRAGEIMSSFICLWSQRHHLPLRQRLPADLSSGDDFCTGQPGNE